MTTPLPQSHLLLDSRIVARTDNAHLRLGAVVKDPHNPLFVADKPWEAFLDNLYGNVMYDEEEQLFKLWYGPFIYWQSRTAAGHSGEWTESGVCYATSRDGLHWDKPELGIVEFEGSRRNNLVKRMAHGAGVFKDFHDPDPARRYKMFYKDQHHRTPQEKIDSRLWTKVATSPDGWRWTDEPRAEMPFWSGKQCDTHNNCFWDERRQQYVLITRTWLGSQQDPGFRIVARMESPDFLRWTRPVDILRERPEEIGHRQIYAMPVFPCHDSYLGLAMLFNTDEGNWTVDCELTWSPNTWHWHRVCPGTPLIPRGHAGSCDAGTIYGCHTPIVRPDGIYIYYGGFDRPHHGFRAGSLCLARLRPDGWAGYEPADPTRQGIVDIAALRSGSPDIRVTADALEGALTVEALDAGGQTIARSREMTGTLTDHPAEWIDPPRAGRALERDTHLRFTLRNARLYAFKLMSPGEKI